MRAAHKMMGLLLILAAFAGNTLGVTIGTLGNNITIFDGDPASTWETWDGGAAGLGDEDNEVDYGSTAGQIWDLEGFFFHAGSSLLTGVGGFDFVNGVSGLLAGDVFIDAFGDPAQIPADSPQTTSNFGYDYVLDFGWNDEDGTPALVYDIIAIADGVVLDDTWASRPGSNPYRYESGGQIVRSGIVAAYWTGLGDDLDGNGSVDVRGDRHNAFQVDLSWLTSDYANFTVHQTMECGNDGHNGHVPDGGITLALLGMALVGLGAIARKK